MRLFRLIAFIIFFCTSSNAQSFVISDITGISFRNENYIGTVNKTLEYLKHAPVQQKLLKELYTVCSKKWNLLPDTSFTTQFQVLKRGSIPSIQKTKKQSAFSIELMEIAAAELLNAVAKDAEDVQKINAILRSTTATYQISIQYNPLEGSPLQKSGYFLVQRRPGIGFGLYSPEYDTSPSGFQSLLQKAVEILLDTTTTNSAIQVVGAQPAVYADNFMMQFYAGKTAIQTTKNNAYVQLKLATDNTVLLRFDSSRFFGLNLEAKKIDNFPEQIRKAIEMGRKNRSYQFAARQQEFRSVLSDNNYFSSIIEMADPAYLDGYSSYLKYLPDNQHVLLRNNDTIARFKITVWKAYPERKFYYNKLYNGVDTSLMLEVDMPKLRTTEYQTPQEFEGVVFEKPFKVITAPAFTYREIYFNNQLVMLAKGFSYPEYLILFDTKLSTEEIEALLILAFIETEPMMGFKNL
jgi:hypothetical protein